MNRKISYLLIVLLVLFIWSCSVNNFSNSRLLTDKYLTEDNFLNYIKNKEKNINDEFLLYNLSYFAFPLSGGNLPEGETEYLLIPKKKGARGYFELYRYSNYSKVVKLKDIVDIEYETIKLKLQNIKMDKSVDCDRTNENSMSYGFMFYFNLKGFKTIISTPMLLDTHMTKRKKYLCFQTYLNSILFMRELDYYGSRRYLE